MPAGAHNDDGPPVDVLVRMQVRLARRRLLGDIIRGERARHEGPPPLHHARQLLRSLAHVHPAVTQEPLLRGDVWRACMAAAHALLQLQQGLRAARTAGDERCGATLAGISYFRKA